MSDQIQTQESQILDAIKVYHTLEKPNIAKLAREFEVLYQRLSARIHGRENKTTSASLKKALNPIQEKVLRI
jgi:molybdopterin-biosynthesis enzyme MoeA-like protein